MNAAILRYVDVVKNSVNLNLSRLTRDGLFHFIEIPCFPEAQMYPSRGKLCATPTRATIIPARTKKGFGAPARRSPNVFLISYLNGYRNAISCALFRPTRA